MKTPVSGSPGVKNDFSRFRRFVRDASGAVAMTYVVFAVLLVVAVVAGVIVFSGVLSGGTETAGHAAGGRLDAAQQSAETSRENYEAASARALASMVAIQGGELAFSHDSGGVDVGNAKEDEPKRLNEHKVNHPVAVEIGHTVLDLAGLIPGIGDAVDLANAAWYEKDGRHVEAVITAAAAVPVAGTAAVAVKWGNNAAKLAKLVFKDGKLVKVITKEGKVLEKEGGKIAKDAGKNAAKESGKTGGEVVDIHVERAEQEPVKIGGDNGIDAREGFNKVSQRNKTTEQTRVYTIKKQQQGNGPDVTTVEVKDVQHTTIQNSDRIDHSGPFPNYDYSTQAPVSSNDPVSGVPKVEKVKKDSIFEKGKGKYKNDGKKSDGNNKGENGKEKNRENPESGPTGENIDFYS